MLSISDFARWYTGGDPRKDEGNVWIQSGRGAIAFETAEKDAESLGVVTAGGVGSLASGIGMSLYRMRRSRLSLHVKYGIPGNGYQDIISLTKNE